MPSIISTLVRGRDVWSSISTSLVMCQSKPESDHESGVGHAGLDEEASEEDSDAVLLPKLMSIEAISSNPWLSSMKLDISRMFS
jgi:hypothetical protein